MYPQADRVIDPPTSDDCSLQVSHVTRWGRSGTSHVLDARGEVRPFDGCLVRRDAFLPLLLGDVVRKLAADDLRTSCKRHARKPRRATPSGVAETSWRPVNYALLYEYG
jgi:hypothetical protein